MTHGILQAALNGGERRENDFYPTPPEPTIALLPHIAHWPRKIWEPACGDGGIAKPLESAGYSVVGTDLIDRGYGTGGLDFLAEQTRRADAIVTNPPFGNLVTPFGNLVTPFIEHAIDLDVPYIAMLVNVNLWHAANRIRLWNRRIPEAAYAICWKPDFTGGGRPYFNCIWTVWGPKSAAVTRYEQLRRPTRHVAPSATSPATRLLKWNAAVRRVAT